MQQQLKEAAQAKSKLKEAKAKQRTMSIQSLKLPSESIDEPFRIPLQVFKAMRALEANALHRLGNKCECHHQPN